MPAVPFLLAGAAFSGAAAAIGTTIAATITTAAISTAAATAIGVGALSAVATAVQGGSVSDVLKSAVLGGVSSYVGGTIAADIGTSVAQDAFFSAIDAGFASSSAIAASNFAGSAVTGAITSSFNALLNEQDPIEALIKGGLTAGVSSAVSSAVNEVIKDIPGLDEIRGTVAGSAVERALKTSITNQILTNKSFDESFIESLTSSGTSYLFNEVQSTLKDFTKDLLRDSDLVKRSEEQVDGLINREKDLVTTINSFVPAVEESYRAVQDNANTQNYWAQEANNLVPELQNLASKANSVTAMVNEMNGPYGFNHWAVQKAPDRFLTDRAGGTYGNYEFTSSWESESNEFGGYSWLKVIVVNKDTGARLYTAQQLIDDVNANAAYINNTYPPLQGRFDNAINNLNAAKGSYDGVLNNYNTQFKTLNGYKSELETTRLDYNKKLDELNTNHQKYQTTLNNFVFAEAENAGKIENLLNDAAQVMSSYEADYGVKPTDEQLAYLFTSGNGDITKGYASFDVNNVSEKEAEAFFGELGYTPTEDEIKQFVGQVSEDAVREAREFLEANEYTPTDFAVRQFIGQVNEADARANIADYVNQNKISPDVVDSIAGAAGNDSIPAGVGVDTVGGIAGADTVNAGVAENDVLDLIQKDINTSVANNVQDVSNAEQEVQPVTPVEPGIDTVGSAAQDDVLGVVAQEQADIRAQTASQAMQGAKQITAAEAAARELYPLTERYQGPNGTIYVRDINTGKITQLLPTGEASAITGGGVFLDRPDVIGAVEALPANAVYQGILYANDPKLIGKQLTADDLENLSLSTDRDANVLPVGNLVVRQNADGTVTQFDKVTGDTATIDASGKIIGQTKSLYTRLNDTANAVTGTGQSALGELGASLSATGQQLGLNTQGLIENFQAMQAAGERMRPETVNQQSTAFVNEIYQIASRPGVTAKEIAEAVVNASKNNPIGAVAVLGSELIQELPALLLPGGNVAKFLGSMALNVGESAGAQALQKIDELKVSNPTATPQELARLARQDAGIAALTTASLSLIPGANNALVRTLTEPFSEALEEGLIEYATSGDINAARGKAVLGAVIGGKTSTAINTGEQLASAAQAKLGVQLPSNTPIASITVTAPRDTTNVVSSGGVDLNLNEDIVGELPPTDLTDLINIPINVGSTSNDGLTISTGNNNVVAGNENNGVVLQNNNDGTSLVLTQGGGSTVVPSVDSSTDNQLQPGSTVVVNTANNTASTAPVTQPTGSEVVSQDAGQVGGTGSALPSTPTTPPLVIEPTPPTSEVTGIVLQNNGDGTALVLTNDGNAANVPVTDAVNNEPLTPGSSVTIDQNTNTATVTPPASNVEEPVVQEPTSPPQPPPAVPTTPEEPITEPPQEPVVSVPTTDAGSIIDTPIGTDTSTSAVTPGLDVNVNPNVNVDEPIPPVDELPLVDEFPPVEDRLPPLPPPDKTEEDLLLEQIIKELESTAPPVSEGVPIPEPEFPEPPLVLPESPTINVADRLTVRPVVDRGYRRPSVSPGSRVEESAQILPLRPGLSEGGTGGIEGTTEQEQEPVWNVRSLKLRRLLGI